MSLKNVPKWNLLTYFKLLSVVFIYFVDGEPAVQDKSVLKYSNPKYLKDVQVVMFRRRRSDPYSTNITATTLQSWNNNVSMTIFYHLEEKTAFNKTVKVCDSVDKLWMVELLRLFTNITECPLPAGTYGLSNLRVLPKYFPVPAPSSPNGSSSRISFTAYLTATKELLVDILVHVSTKSKI